MYAFISHQTVSNLYGTYFTVLDILPLGILAQNDQLTTDKGPIQQGKSHEEINLM